MNRRRPGTKSARARGAPWFELWLRDAQYAVRGLRNTRGFTITVILILALGVGANAAMFTLVDHLFFREPSGIVDPAAVVTATEVSGRGYFPAMAVRRMNALRASVQGMATVAEQDAMHQGIDRETGPRVWRVTANYFSMLGVRMSRGRPFTPDEAADSLPVAIVSYRYWQRALNGDTAILGRSIELVDRRYTVVGVVAPAFTGTTLEPADIWLPQSPEAPGGLIMRLGPGVSRARVEAAMTVALRRTLPPVTRKGYQPPSIRTNPLVWGRQDLGGTPTQLVIIERVAAVAGIILLVAVANAATLLLMRATRRRREIAVRLALGVSRTQLVRQLITEVVLLSVVAGGAAVLAGVWGGAVVRAEFMTSYRLTYPLLDWRLVVFGLGVAIAAGVVAGVAPAIQATHPDLTQSLKAGGRDAYRRSWFRGGLVVLQAALSVVLVVGAGLFVQSLRKIHDVPLGLDVNQLMFAAASFDRGDSIAAFIPAMKREAARVATIPGVRGAAVAAMPPLMGLLYFPAFHADGDTLILQVQGRRAHAVGNAVSPGYFSTVGMRLVDGRDFTSGDAGAGQQVLVVSQTLARMAWPTQRAVGQCLILSRPGNPCAQVIGVVSDANLANITPESSLDIFVPLAQAPFLSQLALVVRGDAVTRRVVTQAVRHDLDAALPASTSIRMADLATTLDPRYAQWTLGAVVFTAMGLLALLVSGVGMYSIIGYSVSQRMHEMGVRVALGARRGQVMRGVVMGGVRLAAIGVVIGIGAALVMGRLVASLLYETSARDPLSMAGAAVILFVAAILASLMPARRAARADPLLALRAE